MSAGGLRDSLSVVRLVHSVIKFFGVAVRSGLPRARFTANSLIQPKNDALAHLISGSNHIIPILAAAEVVFCVAVLVHAIHR